MCKDKSVVWISPLHLLPLQTTALLILFNWTKIFTDNYPFLSLHNYSGFTYISVINSNPSSIKPDYSKIEHTILQKSFWSWWCCLIGGRGGIWTRDLHDANVAIIPGWSTRPTFCLASENYPSSFNKHFLLWEHKVAPDFRLIVCMHLKVLWSLLKMPNR